MDKNNLKKSDKAITEGFFIDYMDNFANDIARGFNDERENNNKRFEQMDKRFDRLEHQNAAAHVAIRSEMKSGFDKIDRTLSSHGGRLDRIEHDIAEIKNQLNRLDKRTDQDDSALFHDIDILRVKIAKLEKEVKFLKLRQAK